MYKYKQVIKQKCIYIYMYIHILIWGPYSGTCGHDGQALCQRLGVHSAAKRVGTPENADSPRFLCRCIIVRTMCRQLPGEDGVSTVCAGDVQSQQ